MLYGTCMSTILMLLYVSNLNARFITITNEIKVLKFVDSDMITIEFLLQGKEMKPYFQVSKIAKIEIAAAIV